MSKFQDNANRQKLAPVMALLARRLGAISYDTLVVMGGLMIMTLPYLGIRAWLTEQESPNPGNLGFQVYVFMLIFGYVWVSWRRGGQTIGMKAWHLKALSLDGTPLSHVQIVTRFCLAIPSIMLCGIGLWWSLFHPQQLTLHEQLSNSQTRFQAKVQKLRL